LKTFILLITLLAVSTHAQTFDLIRIQNNPEVQAIPKLENTYAGFRNEKDAPVKKVIERLSGNHRPEKSELSNSKEVMQILRGGSEGTGGGDPCEDQIKIIRNDLSNWIKNGGPYSLRLPEDIDVNSYSRKMLEQIAGAKIQCVGYGDRDYPIQVFGTPKVCKFQTVAGQESVISCDRNSFRELSETEQYLLIHHEFAGLSGLEKPNLADSNYQISNQISGFLENQVVKRLSIKPKASPIEQRILVAKAIMEWAKKNAKGRQICKSKSGAMDISLEGNGDLPFDVGVSFLNSNKEPYFIGNLTLPGVHSYAEPENVGWAEYERNGHRLISISNYHDSGILHRDVPLRNLPKVGDILIAWIVTLTKDQKNVESIEVNASVAVSETSGSILNPQFEVRMKSVAADICKF
jgi:hypothetical protein